MQALAGLAGEEIGEQLALDEIGDQQGNRYPLAGDRFAGMVLDGNGAMAQLVQLARIQTRHPVTWISLWIKQLDGALDRGVPFAHQENLPFPAPAELLDDLVFARQQAPGPDIELLDGRCIHLSSCHADKSNATGEVTETVFRTNPRSAAR